jgi:membrane fusion protein, multidrug efflux system
MLAPSETEVEQPVLPGIEQPKPAKRPKRRLFAPFIVPLVAAIIGFGAWRYLWPHGTPEKHAQQDVQSVGAAKVETAEINETIAGLGTVTPLATITVQTQINGQLMDVGSLALLQTTRCASRRDLFTGLDLRPWSSRGRRRRRSSRRPA